MRTNKGGARFVALLAGGAIALAGCSTGSTDSDGDSGDGDAASETRDITITAAHEQEFNAYNNGTGQDNAVKNTVVLNQVLGNFWEFDTDGSVIPNEEFGTYEKTSDSPLTVEYSINEDATWSDGEPIDCDDYVLFWASNSGFYDEGETILFDTSGTTGVELSEKPTCEDGDKDFTVVYTEPYADWIAGISNAFLPAHIAEAQSGVEDIIAAVNDDDRDALTKVAEFWNTGWRFDPGAINAEITPSSGPYSLGDWTPGQSISLVANEDYWGTPAKAGTITIRFIVQEQQAQALENGDVQIAEPQPNPDVIAQLEGIGDSVTVDQGDEFTFEHLDFNFESGMSNAKLREAFALCVPRDQIVDRLIKPVNPNAQIAQSRYYLPFQPEYGSVSDEIQEGNYDTADIAASKALVDGENAAGTKVRIGYQIPNQRRTDTVGLIKASCDQAGFVVEDAGQDDFFESGLSSGNFDVALFAWSGSPLVSGSSSTYITGGGNNNGKYTNPQVDTLIGELDVTPDPDEQVAKVTEVEKLLWSDLATIPLYAFPGVIAYSNAVEGVTFQPSQTQVFWNVQEWNTKE